MTSCGVRKRPAWLWRGVLLCGFALIPFPGAAAELKAWNARILPASFVVGPDGAVRYSAIGEIDWDDERVAMQVSQLLPAKQ